MSCTQTFLSEKVQFMINLCENKDPKEPSIVDEKIINVDGIVNWAVIIKHFKVNDKFEESQNDFMSSLQTLHAFFEDIESFVSSLNQDEFQALYKTSSQWSSFWQIIQISFELLQNKQKGNDVLSLLLLTAVIERSLGNVMVSQGKQCPSLLKDLLMTEDLTLIFTKIIMRVIRLVIGPPTSLNLRNIAWHGFLLPMEVPLRYLYFLLILIPNLGHILAQQNLLPLQDRPMLMFQTMDSVLNFKKDLSLDIQKLFEAIKSSTLILASTCSLWKLSIQLYEEKQFGLSAVLMLPQLEHALRILFTNLNNCPQRCLTAESTTLYTTFDEILSCKLEDRKQNKLPHYLGEGIMSMLLDLLMYPMGPRVRDKLSHGEADLDSFPEALMDAIVVTSLVVLHTGVEPPQQQEEVVSKINAFKDNYESLFHPISIINQKMKTLAVRLAGLNKSIHYTYTLEQRESFHWSELHRADEVNLEHVMNKIHLLLPCFMTFKENAGKKLLKEPMSDGEQLFEELLSKKITTLFRFDMSEDSDSANTAISLDGKQQSQICVLLDRILSEIQGTLDNVDNGINIKQTLMKEGKLANRQFHTFSKIIQSIPVIHIFFTFVMMVACKQLFDLDQPLASKRFIDLIKFHKSLLKLVENLRSCTSSDKNKWIESCELLIKFLDVNENNLLSLFV